MTALLFLSILLQTPNAGQDCSISGRVSSLSTGSPLRKAQVHLAVQGVNSRLTETATTTDAEGNFRFDHLASGKYAVRAERSGYLMSSAPSLPCPSSDVTIKMPVQGLIYGRVLDDEGEPIGRIA